MPGLLRTVTSDLGTVPRAAVSLTENDGEGTSKSQEGVTAEHAVKTDRSTTDSNGNILNIIQRSLNMGMYNIFTTT